jgi:23S rRNA pseudouridine1911/1915/1917 synthase
LVVLARTSKAAARLTAAFAERRVEKIYWGVAARCPEPSAGSLEQWLIKDRERNRVHVVEAGTEHAKLARTDWSTLERGPRSCLVELRPSSGRPHQLRVAMASLGAPLLGDLRYGANEPLPDRSVALHARLLELPHPTRNQRLRFELPPPNPGPGTDPRLDVWQHAQCRRERELGVRVTTQEPPS